MQTNFLNAPPNPNLTISAVNKNPPTSEFSREAILDFSHSWVDFIYKSIIFLPFSLQSIQFFREEVGDYM